MSNLVIYHKDCTDGFGAAFCAWQHFKDEDTEYLPLQYGQVKTMSDLGNAPKRAIDDDTEIYILDFSLPFDVMEFLFANAKKVVWLDHHKTAFEMYELPVGQFEDINGNRHVELDNDRSGAMIAWDYFNPFEHAPMFIQHIDDRDRWQFKLGDSKAFHAGMAALKPWSFEQWRDVLYDTYNYADVIVSGRAIESAQERMVKSMSEKARPCVITWTKFVDAEEYIVEDSFGLAINTNMFMSEVGHELANASESYGLVYYIGSDNKVKCSLRSNGDYDVSAIAKSFGGGGHRNAAGFETHIVTLMGWLE